MLKPTKIHLKKDPPGYILFLKNLPSYTQFNAVASSQSMRPTIKRGDTLTITKTPYQSLNRDSIAAFISPNRSSIIVHRVISIYNNNGRKCKTKGDNNPRPDPWIFSSNDFIGEVVSIKRWSNLFYFFHYFYKTLSYIFRYKILHIFLKNTNSLII